MSTTFSHHPAECSTPYTHGTSLAAETASWAEHMGHVDGPLVASCTHCAERLAEHLDIHQVDAILMIRAGRVSL